MLDISFILDMSQFHELVHCAQIDWEKDPTIYAVPQIFKKQLYYYITIFYNYIILLLVIFNITQYIY